MLFLLSTTIDILHRIRKNYFKIHMEPIKSLYSQDNSKQKKQSWRYNTTQLQTILQCYSNQNSMVLVQKQTHRPMEKNGELRIRPYTYNHMIFGKSDKKQTMVKEFPI